MPGIPRRRTQRCYRAVSGLGVLQKNRKKSGLAETSATGKNLPMITKEQIKEMPLDQKLRLMEDLWDDIRSHGDELESPDWHREELEATQKRYEAGLEKPIPWEEAKRQLLDRDD